MPGQKAIKVHGPGKASLETDSQIPKLRDGYIRARVKAVALNPADWKMLDFFGFKDSVLGTDYSGIVEEVSPDVTTFKKGDRVAGMAFSADITNSARGSFQEIVVSKATVTAKIPDTLSFEEAATFPAGISTVALALYQALGIAWPTTPIADNVPLLIYGGSTATGTLAIQFAKLSGYEVITTASAHNQAHLKSLGADHVFDYKTPDLGAQIRKFTDDKLKLVLDCHADGDAPAICADAISTAGGIYSTLGRVESPRKDVETKSTIAFQALGEDMILGGQEMKAIPEVADLAAKFWKLAAELLEQGKIKAHPVKVVDGGLETILDSLDYMRQGKVSGVKLVHVIS